MRSFAPALAVVAGAFVSSRAHADEKRPPPKLVLADVVGFGTTGTTGWFGYTRSGNRHEADVQPSYVRLEQRSKASQLTIAPRVEVLIGEYVSLGAELAYGRSSYGADVLGAPALGGLTGGTLSGSSQGITTDRFTLVPILGLRVPLPRGLSLWAHAGFGGGAAITSRSGLQAGADPDSAQLVTRFRSDVRLAFEPVRGVMLTAGPELQRTTFGHDRVLGSSSALSAGLWAGVSFVIR